MANLGCQFDTPRKREPLLQNCLIGLGAWLSATFSWLLIGGEPSLLWMVPPMHRWSWGCVRKLGEQVMGKQPSTQHSSMGSDSVPASRFWIGFVPWPATVINFDMGILSWNKPFPLRVGFITETETKLEQCVLGKRVVPRSAMPWIQQLVSVRKVPED